MGRVCIRACMQTCLPEKARVSTFFIRFNACAPFEGSPSLLSQVVLGVDCVPFDRGWIFGFVVTIFGFRIGFRRLGAGYWFWMYGFWVRILCFRVSCIVGVPCHVVILSCCPLVLALFWPALATQQF